MKWASGHPSPRPGGHERLVRPVVRSNSGLSHGREGLGRVVGAWCEMLDDGGRRAEAHCGLMWDKLGSRVAHPDPIRRGEGHSSLLRKLVNMNPGIMVAQS